MERGRLTVQSAIKKQLPIMMYRTARLSGQILIHAKVISYDCDGYPVEGPVSTYAEVEHAKAAAKLSNLRLVKG